jgi:hypothetical protein
MNLLCWVWLWCGKCLWCNKSMLMLKTQVWCGKKSFHLSTEAPYLKTLLRCLLWLGSCWRVWSLGYNASTCHDIQSTKYLGQSVYPHWWIPKVRELHRDHAEGYKTTQLPAHIFALPRSRRLLQGCSWFSNKKCNPMGIDILWMQSDEAS